MPSPFQLDPRLDPSALHAAYRTHQRLHVRGILAGDGAQILHRHLDQEVGWSLALNDGKEVREALPEQRARMPAEREHELMSYAYDGARQGFQFLYECCRIPDDAEARSRDPTLLNWFGDFLNSAPFIEFARALTGFADISWADGQATRYAPGHFLTRHDDSSGAKNRRVAYVMNLTPAWNADWGGQLQFLDADGHISRAYVPRFNAMNLFTVPQLHAVSFVSPFAGAPRYSVTGWLRSP